MLPSRILRSTVNAAEISFFSRLSSQWWDERGEFAFLHQMNPVRVQFIRQKLLETARDEDETASQNVLKGLQVLDVGCGGGLLSESLARLGARTVGIDASESNIEIAKHHASTDSRLSKNLSYLHTSAESLLSQPKRYDVVCSMEVLEHVDNPALFLSTCAQLLKPSGHLFLSTISRTSLAYFLTILMAENVLRRVAPGTHTYSKFVKPSELVTFFQSYGSRPWITPSAAQPTRTEAEVRGIMYNPLSSSWNLAPRDAWAATECNYMFWVRKPAE
ncbi:S-adenosyl-L-methionine-dependent methyltransferase [Armillaria luteobubalina]|uniref:Ubiquinone biosynthesis O-methyltransferase, mitochondrial n=1 Tax=Armillaria luteobubalina TaxID=153913 RepID=A0AA39USK9_9AGAR|nr:S-adenosyl-L-methionine-dependent methyltransferase [Armillaria luteobubalina]